MTLKLRFSPGAAADYRTIYREYEKARPGLEDEFRFLFRKIAVRILNYPQSSPVIYRGARRLLLGKFPFHLYYRVHGKTLKVVAILPARQDPKASRKRIRREH